MASAGLLYWKAPLSLARNQFFLVAVSYCKPSDIGRYILYINFSRILRSLWFYSVILKFIDDRFSPTKLFIFQSFQTLLNAHPSAYH